MWRPEVAKTSANADWYMCQHKIEEWGKDDLNSSYVAKGGYVVAGASVIASTLNLYARRKVFIDLWTRIGISILPNSIWHQSASEHRPINVVASVIGMLRCRRTRFSPIAFNGEFSYSSM